METISSAAMAGRESENVTKENKQDNMTTTQASIAWAEWTKRLHAYVAWSNSQLRKRPGCRLIGDLRVDLKDGVLLAELVEIVSGKRILGISTKPLTYQSRFENVRRVLHFMAMQGMQIAHITVKEICEGNLRAVMRLIFSLASHYKPKSVSSAANKTTKPVPAPGAPIKKETTAVDFSHAWQAMDSYLKRSRGFTNCIQTTAVNKYSTWDTRRPAKSTFSYSDYDDYGDYAQSDSDESLKGASIALSSSWRRSLASLNERLIDGGGEVDGASCIGSPTPSIARLKPAKSMPYLRDSKGDELGHSKEQAMPTEFRNIQGKMDKHQEQLLSGGHSDPVSEMRYQGASSGSTNGSPAEDMVVSFQNRISNQDKTIMEMRCELGKLQLTKQSLEADKEELMNQIESKESQINELKKQLLCKDKVMMQQKLQFEDAVKNLSLANKAKACLTARLVDQDKKLAVLEQVRNPKPLMREELQVVRDALHSLRTSFVGNNPHHHTLDTLEQSIALLMERLHMAEAQKFSRESCSLKPLNFDSTGDPKRSPITAYDSPLQRFDVAENGTKVVYFTERAVTPFMSSIPKRMGDIKLRDFKSMFDRPGNYRFHFKSVDPEYGVVKEEIINDESILPGWDGKIVAWVEEENE